MKLFALKFLLLILTLASAMQCQVEDQKAKQDKQPIILSCDVKEKKPEKAPEKAQIIEKAKKTKKAKTLEKAKIETLPEQAMETPGEIYPTFDKIAEEVFHDRCAIKEPWVWSKILYSGNQDVLSGILDWVIFEVKNKETVEVWFMQIWEQPTNKNTGKKLTSVTQCYPM